MVEHKQVRTFVGVDAHSVHCTLNGQSRQGRTVLEVEVPTDVGELRKAVKAVRGPVWAMVEASAMAPFVKWALDPVVGRVIVCETRRNRSISDSEEKDDPRDAEQLARLLRMKEFKEVYVPCRDRQELRDLVRLYDKTVKDRTRVKNRIKAKYREQGLPVEGYGVYEAEGRKEYMEKIDRPTVRICLEVLYAGLDAVEAASWRLGQRVNAMVRHRKEYKVVTTVPGYGPVNGGVLVAVIDNPHRFPTVRKAWKYAGLSVRRRTSGESKVKTGGSFSGNRLLKYAVMLAAKRALQGENQFSRHHAQMLERGLDPAMADKTIARRLLATALAVWKSGKDYQEPERTP
jgi:transposase